MHLKTFGGGAGRISKEPEGRIGLTLMLFEPVDEWVCLRAQIESENARDVAIEAEKIKLLLLVSLCRA